MWLFLNLSTAPSHSTMFTQVSRVDIYPSHLWMAISNCENCWQPSVSVHPKVPRVALPWKNVYLNTIVCFLIPKNNSAG